MAYIDGFVLAVPTANKEAYIKTAESINHLYTKHGAQLVMESWGDDVPHGETTDFYKAVKATDDETVVFSLVIWPDKATREAGNAKIMEDMKSMDEAAMPMPFDGKRMIYGGFESIVKFEA